MPNSPSDRDRDRLPFEPSKRKPSSGERSSSRSASATSAPSRSRDKATKGTDATADQKETPSSSSSQTAQPSRQQPIPKVVSDRMARRMLAFCGIPTLIGLATFPAVYLMGSQGWLEIPNIAVLIVSLAGFVMGIVGLSYGVFSASWEEENEGSLLGFREFSTNVGRAIADWRRGRSQKQ